MSTQLVHMGIQTN